MEEINHCDRNYNIGSNVNSPICVKIEDDPDDAAENINFNIVSIDPLFGAADLKPEPEDSIGSFERTSSRLISSIAESESENEVDDDDNDYYGSESDKDSDWQNKHLKAKVKRRVGKTLHKRKNEGKKLNKLPPNLKLESRKLFLKRLPNISKTVVKLDAEPKRKPFNKIDDKAAELAIDWVRNFFPSIFDKIKDWADDSQLIPICFNAKKLGKNLSCLACDRVFKDSKLLLKHLKNHPQQQLTGCSLCGKISFGTCPMNH